MNRKSILIGIPAYNCEEQIVRVIASLKAVNGLISEVIVVDNLSSDSTVLKALNCINEHKNFDFKISVLKNFENYSLGGTHKVIFKYALDNNYEYSIILHGDDQADISDVQKILLNSQYSGVDLILGSRFMSGAKRIGYSKFRIFGNYFFLILFSLCTKKFIWDMGSGLNMYSKKYMTANATNCCPDDLVFHCYYLLKCIKLRARIVFFPISWREEDQVSNAKLFRQSMQIIALLFRFFLMPNKVLGESRGREHYESKKIV